MVQLLVKDINNQWVILDLNSDLAISLNKSVEEIEDLTQRKSSYSKTFSIPGTKKNETFFKSSFDVNATDFNSSLLTDCVIQDDGNDVFRGSLRLNKITVTPNGNLYEVYILEEISLLSTSIQEFTLCDLDYSDIDHTVDYDNIVLTWDFSGGSYSNYSGIVGKVLYPLCNTGYDTSLGYGEWNFGSSGLTNSGTPLSISQFKPWFNAKYILDKVFEKANFSYISEFFDSDYFKSIFLLGGTNDTSATAIIGDRPENQNFFHVNYEGSLYIYPPDGEYPNYNYSTYQTIVFNTEQYDYLQQYSLSNFPDSGPGTGGNYYLVPIDGAYQFRIKQTMGLYGTVTTATYINVVLRDIDSGAIMDSYTNVVIPVGSPTTYEFLFSATLTKGQRISVQFNRVSGVGSPFNNILFNQQDSIYESYVSPTIVPTLGDIKVSDNILCMTGLDYLRNLLKLFNLNIIIRGERNVIIEPYVNYLSSASGDTINWSQKLDYSQSYEIEPLDYSLNKKLKLSYTLGTDYLSQRHFENFDKIFGEKIYEKQSQLLTGELDMSVGFESMPCESVGSSGTTMVIPSLYRYEPEQQIQIQPISNGMKIGFYCGLVPFYTASTDTSLATYYIQSGGTSSISHNYYPAINHLSQLTNDNEFSDLNYQPSWDFFKGNADFEIYTANNVYNQFYRQYLSLLYSDDVRLFTGNFKLTPEDVSNINFNDNVYFLNAVWRLYEISDADITQESIVKCKFIKQPYDLGKITLVPPNYTEQSATRIPSPTPTPTPVYCEPHSFYQSFSQEDVCNQTAPTSTLYSNCSTITIGCKVYLDSSCSTPVNAGRFVYPTAASSSSYIYVVSDLNGTLAESLCS